MMGKIGQLNEVKKAMTFDIFHRELYTFSKNEITWANQFDFHSKEWKTISDFYFKSM